MIVEWIFAVFVSFLGFVVGLLPSIAVPGWVDDSSGHFATVWAAGAGLGAWIPWTLAASVVAAILSCVVIGLAIKVIRIVASFLTVGGGSAG